jgi:uncharacterized protein (TIGR00661 family)
MVFKMFRKLPSIIYIIIREHRKLKKIIKKYDIDAVISDNRYGLFSKRVPSIFISHQLMIKCPNWLKFFEPLLYLANNFFISKYTACWVPDYSGKINLSGDLSHKYPRLHKIYFIGPQSRLYNTDNIHLSNSNIYDLMVILSGPEPQRSILEDIIISQLSGKNIKAIVVLGKLGGIDKKDENENVTIYSYLTSDNIIKYMNQSNIILCRSGYSSIMDLSALGKKAILIPTPGQTEQEYLAQFFMKKKIFYSQLQNRLDICEALKESEEYNGIRIKGNASLLNKRLDELFGKIKK